MHYGRNRRHLRSTSDGADHRGHETRSNGGVGKANGSIHRRERLRGHAETSFHHSRHTASGVLKVPAEDKVMRITKLLEVIQREHVKAEVELMREASGSMQQLHNNKQQQVAEQAVQESDEEEDDEEDDDEDDDDEEEDEDKQGLPP